MIQHLNPLNWFRWLGQFVFAWFVEIEWPRMAAAVPAVLVLLALVSTSALSYSRSDGWRNRIIDEQLASAVQREEFDKVDLLLRRRMRTDPENRELHLRLGLFRAASGNHEEAVATFKQLVHEEADSQAALWLLTHATDLTQLNSWNAQQLEEFGEWTSLAVRDYPRDIRANAAHAEYLIACGDAPQAVLYLQKVAPAQPMQGLRAAAILRAGGQESSAQGIAEAALAKVAGALADAPRNLQLRMLHAQSLVFLKRYPEAVKTLEEAAQRTGDAALKPVIAEALVLWAQSLEEDDAAVTSLRQRLQLLQRAVAYAPANPAVLNAISGTVLATVDQDDAQVAALRESLIAGSSPGISHFIRGTTLMMQDKPEDAALHLQLAAKQLPQTPAILNNLAVAFAARPDADLQQALKLVEQAIEQAVASPKGPTPLPYFYETRGQILLKSERYLDSIADLEKALIVPELRAQAHQGLARAYQGLGQKELAESHQAQADKGTR